MYIDSMDNKSQHKCDQLAVTLSQRGVATKLPLHKICGKLCWISPPYRVSLSVNCRYVYNNQILTQLTYTLFHMPTCQRKFGPNWESVAHGKFPHQCCLHILHQHVNLPICQLQIYLHLLTCSVIPASQEPFYIRYFFRSVFLFNYIVFNNLIFNLLSN